MRAFRRFIKKGLPTAGIIALLSEPGPVELEESWGVSWSLLSGMITISVRNHPVSRAF
jgi:hypothetical protein